MDVVACLKLLKRNPRCGELPLPPKAAHEALKAEVKRIVIKMLTIRQRWFLFQLLARAISFEELFYTLDEVWFACGDLT